MGSRIAALLWFAGWLSGCAEEAEVADLARAPWADASAVPEGAEVQGEAVDAWEQAARDWDVPLDLLQAYALAETGMQMVVGIDGHDERPAGYGVMGLRGARVDEAAAILGVEPDQVRYELAHNVAGAAALLSGWADEAGVDREDLAAWAPLVARLSGIELEEAQAEFVWKGVYRRLRYGAELEGRRIKAYGVDPDFRRPAERVGVAGPNYASSIWRPSPNYDSRNPSAGGIGMVVIHTCEGGYSGCWSWLTNPSSGVSAHYVVNETGSEVSQLVNESQRAWHVGAAYDCSLNGGTDCWRDGWNVNHFSVGIEHGGWASQTSWDTGLLQTSAELTCDITRDNGIPRDNYHIVAHGTLQPWSRYDPGPNWPWTDYINRVRVACGDVPGGGGGPPPSTTSFVIDSNNGFNDTSVYYIEVSSSWISSTSVAGYWNTGYWAAPTQAISDTAKFWFLESGPACYDVEAWWTAAFDRSRAAPFIAYDAGSVEVGRTYADQSVNHARWNHLGTWAFGSGWNRIALSRWATTGYYVIADAVRLTPSTACAGCQFQDPDGDGTTDCTDGCPLDAGKVAAGVCGCGVADVDGDGDGAMDCVDACPTDPGKTTAGSCGCGVPDVDGDGDGVLSCLESCPTDPAKTSPGTCGCGTPEEDVTGDGVADCTDCGDGVLEAPEGCDDGGEVGGDGCSATCQLEALELARPTPGVAGQINTFRARGAVSGAQVRFYAGNRAGGTSVAGCPGLTIPFSGALDIGVDAADGGGLAELQLFVPAASAGRTFGFVAVDLGSCRMSGLVLERF